MSVVFTTAALAGFIVCAGYHCSCGLADSGSCGVEEPASEDAAAIEGDLRGFKGGLASDDKTVAANHTSGCIGDVGTYDSDPSRSGNGKRAK